MRLDGKVAVVTGAASGMGLAMARIFCSEGAKVVAGDRNVGRLETAVAEINALGGAIHGVPGDIGTQADAELLIDTAVATYGAVHVLVNNAGIMDYMEGTASISDDIWRKVIAVNLEGPMYTSRRALHWMIENGGGSIINVSSTAGISGGAAGTAYTVSKHGVVGLTRSTAWHYATKGIRCNAICPGGTATNIQESMLPERMNSEGGARAGLFATLIPAFLQPNDIAFLALFLASDKSRHINGAIIPADGGWKSV